MEEITKFLALVKRFRLVMIVVPLTIIIITFFLVKNLPNSYVSQAQIATGIVDETKQNLINQSTPQAQQIVQEFSNLIAIMRLNKIVDRVAYKLAIHDLTTAKPFRPKTAELAEMNEAQRRRAALFFENIYKTGRSLNLYDQEENKYNDLLKSLKYDSESLSAKFNIFRSGDSDFIVVQFESEHPLLSSFVVNGLSNEFVSYYTSLVKKNRVSTTTFLGNLLNQRSDTLARRMSDLRDYKIRNRVLNLSEQSKQLYTRIIDYDDKKQEAIQNTASFAGALNEIDRKFNPEERKYLEASLSKLNTRIVTNKEELSRLYDLYYKSDLDEKYKRGIDSLQSELNIVIAKSSDEYINNPLSSKLTLIQEKLGLEIKLDISRYSINSLERELGALNNQFDALVPKEAEVQSLEMKIDIATKEYLDILEKYNQSNLESGFQVKLNIVQPGMPGLAQPSKKMLLVILSGIIGFIICLIVIFISFLLDRSVTTPKGLADKSQAPVLGVVNKLSNLSLELAALWLEDRKDISPLLLEFKDQLRSLRFELDLELKNKVLLITSLDVSEGKTMMALSLAFAWKMSNKRVLLIDGNFRKPDLSSSSQSKVYLEDVFRNGVAMNSTTAVSTIDVLCNRGENTSLLEVATKEEISAKLDFLKSIYDIIIVETSTLGEVNQAKEWLLFSTDIVAVFSSGQEITETKSTLINYLKESGSFLGWIFNKTSSKL
jgi:succinoglycan biosynthesis transport protein ExoP